MLFAIICQDNPDSLEGRKKARPAHLARLETLKQEGRLLLAGPFPAVESDNPGPAGFTGSLIVAEFPSQAEAEKWAASDPYHKEQVYHSVTIKPFKHVLP
ncbi:MAG: YciI family protein [Gammaproteobacteria bacterium]|nr:MAG: YciI family protein [Gammaproteobacteria bacterium]